MSYGTSYTCVVFRPLIKILEVAEDKINLLQLFTTFPNFSLLIYYHYFYLNELNQWTVIKDIENLTITRKVLEETLATN